MTISTLPVRLPLWSNSSTGLKYGTPDDRQYLRLPLQRLVFRSAGKRPAVRPGFVPALIAMGESAAFARNGELLAFFYTDGDEVGKSR